ncbi:cytochrome c biogenesis protein CcsA [Deferribacterales bacterium RsTz2092]
MRVIDVLTLVAIPIAMYFAFIYAPVEARMGVVQKIFYFHVASAWVGFFALFVTFIASIVFLARGSRISDDVANASAEIGFVFCLIVLLTGPIWAKPTWGVWWTWDVRLTTTLVLVFIYAAYLLLRKFIYEPERRGKFCAVVGIIGFVDVPLVFFSIRWWGTIHPNVVQKGGGGLHPDMLTALIVSVLAFTLLYVSLMNKRVRLATLERANYEDDK